MERTANQLKLLLFTALLGASAGAVIWCFLKGVSLCSSFIWETIPATFSLRFLPVLICGLGGLIVGFIHKRYGNYPEELDLVMEKIRKDKYYSYKHILPLLICAFIPLCCLSSVGPEAGLTGIIAALCYWVADNVSFAQNHTAEVSRIGEVITLGQIFHSPLFGIFAVEEGDDEAQLPVMSRGYKLLYYALSTTVSFLVVEGLNAIFGAALSGFPSFEDIHRELSDIVLLLLYIPVGMLIYVVFEHIERFTKTVGAHIPVILRETICGFVIGGGVLFFPMAMSSGEEQMGELIDTFTEYSPLFLMGICILKLLMTAFCINFGMKGGHFFPLIFACTCMGFALVRIIYSDPSGHAAFAAAAVTATVLGAQLKKPIAASLLLLLCFPVKRLLIIFLCAAAGSKAKETLNV